MKKAKLIIGVLALLYALAGMFSLSSCSSAHYCPSYGTGKVGGHVSSPYNTGYYVRR